MRALLTGWASFLHGEATAGDVRSLEVVADRLSARGIAHDVVWSPGFVPDALHFDDAPPEDYTHLLFACGPVHGWQVAELHRRYEHCIRIAVGVSVIDPSSSAARGFHRIIPRDGPGRDATRDLAARPAPAGTPVVGVALAPDQPEYGSRSGHRVVHSTLSRWLTERPCAPLPLETRLAHDDWRLCGSPAEFASLVVRTDVVLTTRLHGLVFALAQGVPAIAVDPVVGGGKVRAQARAWSWPAVLDTESVCAQELDRWWRWCRSPEGRRRAAECARAAGSEPAVLDELSRELESGVPR